MPRYESIQEQWDALSLALLPAGMMKGESESIFIAKGYNNVPKPSGLTPGLRKTIGMMWTQGFSQAEIAKNIEKSEATITRYIKQMIEDGDIEERDGDNAGTEQKIIEETERKHVSKLSEELSTITKNREVKLRQMAASLERYNSIFESIESMGMTVTDFLEAAVQGTYQTVKQIYLEKVQELEDREARGNLLTRIREDGGKNGKTGRENGQTEDSSNT